MLAGTSGTVEAAEVLSVERAELFDVESDEEHVYLSVEGGQQEAWYHNMEAGSFAAYEDASDVISPPSMMSEL